jgi:hypothetical protein
MTRHARANVALGGAVQSLDQPAPITGEEIAQLLRDALAPEPWASPGACQLAAEHLNAVIAQIAYFRAHPIGRTAFDRACDAVDELRRVLPELIEWASLPLTHERLMIGPPPEIAEALSIARSKYLARLAALQDALFEIWPRSPRKSRFLEEDWSHRALILLRWYASIVEPMPRITKNGPAVRFVQAALHRLGEGQRSPEAIEASLRRKVNAAIRRASARVDDKSGIPIL